MEIRDFDWRMYGVTTLTQDLPAAGPGAPYHPAGTPIYASTKAELGSNTLIFGTPSTVKISFNIALTASYEAVVAKEQINLLPHDSGLIIQPEGLPYLYNYFEHYMISVIYSFLTLEIFCNFVIDTKVGKNTVFMQLDKKPKRYSAIELQKENISVIKKILIVLPKILNIPSIEKNDPTLWEKIKGMNTLRNKITHMKPLDVNRGASIDRDSIFAEIINNSPVNFPFYSLNTMDYYKAGLMPKFWITEMRQQYTTKFLDLLKNQKK